KVPGRRTPMNVLVKSSCQYKEHPRRIFGTLRACLMVAVLVLLTILIAAGQSLSASFPVCVSPSLFRVGQTDPPGTVSGITLSSARGETVDAQVVVQAPSNGLTNVNVSASALTGPGGATIPASSITLYR